jgi:hypothetical protein
MIPLPLLPVLADVTGTGAPSDVTSGAVLTLVLPLALLAIVLLWWWLAARRGWPKLPAEQRPAPVRRNGPPSSPTTPPEPPPTLR